MSVYGIHDFRATKNLAKICTPSEGSKIYVQFLRRVSSVYQSTPPRHFLNLNIL